MNFPNKLTMARIIMAVIVIVMLLFPYDQVGLNMPIYEMSNVSLGLEYIISGILFIIAAVTDFVDGNYARKHNMVTDFGKVMDAIADKVLVNGVLIIMAYNRMIPVIVPVIIITRDTVVDSIKMVAGSKGNVVAASIAGKIKTIAMMVGLSLVFFSNLPFELVGLPLDKICVYGATILSLYSGIQYFIVNKKFFLSDK